MATSKEYVVKLTTDATGAIANIDKVDTSLGNLEKTTGSLRSQLKEMQKQLSTLDPNTKAFTELSKKAGDLKDKINDASEAVRANAGNAFESLSNNVGNLGQRLVSLDFEGVGQSFRGIAGAVKGVKISDLTNQVKGAVGGFAQLGKALLVNPIFLIGAAIAVVITQFDKLKGLIDGVSSEQQELALASQKSADAARENVNAVGEQENILRLAGKSEAEILQLKLKQLDAAILAQRAAIDSARITLESQIAAEQRNRNILKGILDFITKPLEFLLAAIDGAGQAFGKDFGLRAGLNGLKDSGLNLLFDPKQIADEGKAAADAQLKALTALENQRAGIVLGQREKAKAESEKRAADQKAANDKLIEEENRKLKEIQDAEAAAAAQAAKDLERINAEKFAAAVKANQERIAQQEALDEEIFQASLSAQDKEIIAIREHFFEKIELAKELGNGELELTAQQEKAIQDIKDKYAKQDQDKKRADAQAKVQIAQQGIQALIAITDGFNAKNEKQARAQFKISKGLRIADATINAFMAASNALATTPLPPPFPQIAAGISLAAGFAQVKNIASQQYGSTSSSGGGSVSTGGGSSPNAGAGVPAFNPVNTDFIGNRPPQAAMSYVLAGDVADATEARSKIENLSRL
jgi:hypothetical protein